MLQEHHENLYNKNHLATKNITYYYQIYKKNEHTRNGKIFLSSVDRSPKPNAGISVSESYFSKVRPIIVIT
jgi:hypothetical protein